MTAFSERSDPPSGRFFFLCCQVLVGNYHLHVRETGLLTGSLPILISLHSG